MSHFIICFGKAINHRCPSLPSHSTLWGRWIGTSFGRGLMSSPQLQGQRVAAEMGAMGLICHRPQRALLHVSFSSVLCQLEKRYWAEISLQVLLYKKPGPLIFNHMAKITQDFWGFDCISLGCHHAPVRDKTTQLHKSVWEHLTITRCHKIKAVPRNDLLGPCFTIHN
jgi:hypothetical protein